MSADSPSPPYDALLLRGGRSAHRDLYRAALTGQEALGRPAVSAFGGAAVSAEEALCSVPTLARYRVFRRTTAGRLYDAGFDVRRTGPSPNHHTIYLPVLGDEWIDRLARCFDEPEPNPLQNP